MKKTTTLLAAAVILYCCGSNNKLEEKNVPAESEQISESTKKATENNFGEKITEEGAIPPEAFLQEVEGKETFTAKLIATIANCCQKKGCWMKLNMGNDQEMRVTFKDYAFFVPKDSDGKTAIVEGFAYRDTVSVDMLKHFAEDAGKSQEEIDAITEPEITFAFEARGVIIKDGE